MAELGESIVRMASFTGKELRELGRLQGPVDHDVPVLTVRAKDGALRAGLGVAAQARCRERYGIAGIAAAYRKVYEEVAAACPVS